MTPQKLAEKYKKLIKERTPEVTTCHTDKEHFYQVKGFDEKFSSVTALQYVIKDQGIEIFQMNEAMRYIKVHYPEFNPENIDKHTELAASSGIVVRDTAGNWGTSIHDYRCTYYQEWIDTGVKPSHTIESLALADNSPLEVISGCAAIDKFLLDTGVIPLAVELKLYSTKWKVAGTGDEIYLWPFTEKIEVNDPVMGNGYKTKTHWEVVFCDLKSSNQYKNFYWVQVCAYVKMFMEIFKIRPKRHVILKVSKMDRTYSLEWIKNIPEQIKIVSLLVNLRDSLKKLNQDRKKEVIVI